MTISGIPSRELLAEKWTNLYCEVLPNARTANKMP